MNQVGANGRPNEDGVYRGADRCWSIMNYEAQVQAGLPLLLRIVCKEQWELT